MKRQPAKSKAAPVAPMGREAMLGQFSEKDRSTFERQVTAYEAKAGGAAADRWQRLARVLMALAPHRPKIGAGPMMQFFIPDGVYRKQVFALRGMADGTVEVYAPDVLSEALEQGVLAKKADVAGHYRLPKSMEMLQVEQFDGKTPNPDAVFKDMTGWNRKAMRMTLPPSSTKDQAATVEAMCALAAGTWVPAEG